MSSKKLQVTVEEPMLTDMQARMDAEKFYEVSEFVKNCIRHYLLEREQKAPGGNEDLTMGGAWEFLKPLN